MGDHPVLLNATKGATHTSVDVSTEPFAELRKLTLVNIAEASDRLKAKDARLEDFVVTFQGGGQASQYPFWNLINGPIADALWHCGQVVSFRRASGNPLNPNVSLFSGKVND